MTKLYNTMSRSKEELVADNPVTLYTCGPTVYLDPHIGNWRTFIFYDTLVRTLKEAGYDVHHVINITDVGHLISDGDTGEDKLTKTAHAQRKTAWEVAENYTQVFLEGLNELNLLKPFKLPKATDHIQEQIQMVKTLEEKGLTYKIDDGIYFDVSKFSDYGKLAGGVKADEEFARINQNDQKKNPEDFALWKFSPENDKRDMEWESPWGVGFPGWHIECSAMAQKYLGDTIDIHAGGIDHIPVHHTNEIAQAEGATGKPFSNMWLHAEFMKVDGSKMSKSKGNYYTLNDVKEKGHPPLAFRMLILQGHYRTETNFTWEILTSAQNRLTALRNAAERRWQIEDSEAELSPDIESAQDELLDAMNDDLNTPRALEVVNKVLSMTKGKIARGDAKAYIEFLQRTDRLLGLNLLEDTPDIDKEQKMLINKRDQAKKIKDFTTADKIRDKLLQQGIELLDTPAGSVWQRIST